MKKKKIKKLLNKYIKWWVHWLGLGYWDINIRFDNKVGHCSAECNTMWQYLSTAITFHLGNIQQMRNPNLESLVVHELMHVFLNEMREKGIKHEERSASFLENAFMWVKNAKSEEKK